MDQKKPPNVVVSGLIKRRRDIQAKSDYLTRQLFALQEDIAALDRSIRIIDSEFNLASIKPKKYIDPDKAPIPYQAEVAQMLSNPEKPLTVAEICDRLISNGHPCGSGKERAMMRDKIKNHLRRKMVRGWVVRENGRYSRCDDMAYPRKSC